MSLPEPRHRTGAILTAARAKRSQPIGSPAPTQPAAATDGSQEPPTESARTIPLPAAPDFRGLIASVRLWEELQRYRIRVGNQLFAIEEAGAAIPIELAAHFGRMNESEDEIEKLILREWAKHPLAPWATSIHGLGEHSVAVLVAMLEGDPLVAYPKHWEDPPADTKAKTRRGKAPKRILVADEPYVRSVSQLWQYCGIGTPGKRRTGMTQDEAFALGKPLLKSRIWQIANSFIKANNQTYRAVYDAARATVAERKHEAACAPCKTKAGAPWKPGHQHAHGLRMIGKRFMADMRDECVRLREAGEWR